MSKIVIVKGSVLDQSVDAIVNAANVGMRGGGGLDGAVHHAAGAAMTEELRAKAPSGCPTGGVIVTGGHASGFRYILHTPGPVWKGGTRGEADALAACYRNSLNTAAELGITSLAFPSISTGIYGYPLKLAAPLALETVQTWLREHPENPFNQIVFAMFGGEEYQVFRRAFGDQPISGS